MNNTYIAHHGILGQKWGKHNGPPYPLSPEDRSAAEKKAASGGIGSWKAKKTIKKDNKALEKIRKRDARERGYRYQRERLDEFDKNSDRLGKTWSDAATQSRYMTDKELADAIARLKNEQSYSALRANDITDGKDWWSKTIVNAATKGVNSLIEEMAKDATVNLYKSVRKAFQDEIKEEEKKKNNN